MANIRIEAKPLPANANHETRERAFRGMFATFKRQVNDSGILTEYNLRSTYESEGQRRRRKAKESQMRKMKEGGLKDRLREHFGQG